MNQNEELAGILVNAAKKALTEVPILWGAIYDPEDDGIRSLINSLARLKTLELFLLKSAKEGVGVSSRDLQALLRDVEKAVMVINLERPTVLSPKELVSFYPERLSEEEFTAAMQKITTGYTKEDIGEALVELRKILKERSPHD